MKTKSLLLAFAGLGLFACSNEDLNEGGIQGEANVVVKINTEAISRTLAAPTSSMAVTGTAVVTLQTADGPQTETLTLDGKVQTASFEGVNAPGAISVNVNQHDGDVDLTDINGLGVNAGLKAPMIASANVSGWDFDSETRTYSGTLTPQHELVSRLEFSGIKHVKDGDKACWFKSITFDGLFLNNIKEGTNKASISSANWNDVTTTNAAKMPCFDEEGDENGFLKDGADAKVYPTDGQCYAYNIVAGDKPILTLCFSNITLTEEQTASGSFWPADGKGYAAVGTYKAKGKDIKGKLTDFGVTGVTDETIEDDTLYEITKFPAGYIYRVSSLEVKDSNIGITIDGKPVNVTATVSIVEWKLVEGSIDWNKQ